VIASIASRGSLGSEPGNTVPQKVKAAATQFEAMLIAQMLSSSRESAASGWGADGDDKTDDTMMEMAEQQLSQVLASTGGFGMAKMVAHELSKASAKSFENR
jgi:Rod binding domain-containing protein